MEQFKKTIKAQGHSVTHPRQAVFTALQNQEPLTMHQLVAACPGVDRASVYRTIALFEQLSIVQRLQIGWKYKLELSDQFHHHHHHLTCLQCGKVIPLPEDRELETRLRMIAAHERFKIKGHQIEIQGLCESCRKS